MTDENNTSQDSNDPASKLREDAAVARQKRMENANLKATRLKPILERVNPDRSLSLHRVAKALNQEEIPTMSGKGQWNAKSVQRVYKRLAA